MLCVPNRAGELGRRLSFSGHTLVFLLVGVPERVRGAPQLEASMIAPEAVAEVKKSHRHYHLSLAHKAAEQAAGGWMPPSS